jgi:hypothetical protein
LGLEKWNFDLIQLLSYGDGVGLQRPNWQPGSIEDVDMGDVKAVFAPFETPADELKIPDTVA